MEHPMVTQINKTGYPKGLEENLSSPNVQLFHVYECEDCVVTFAVEQAFEDQSVVTCPICHKDNNIRDVDSGEMKIGR